MAEFYLFGALAVLTLATATFTAHEINEDNAIIGDTVEEVIEKIQALSWEQ